MTRIIEFTNILDLQEEIFKSGLVEYVFVKLRHAEIEVDDVCFERMQSSARDLDASMVFSGYRLKNPDGSIIVKPGLEYQPGSLRDDFDFGALVCINVADAIGAIGLLRYDEAQMPDGGWYALRLTLGASRMIGMIPEVLYTEQRVDMRHSGEKQHDYVNPRQRSYQEAMERTFLMHLRRIGALTQANKKVLSHYVANVDFEVEMSVVIPVRNRRKTILDAVSSALDQNFNMSFNVIAIDNGSTDGTRELLEEIDDSRFILLKAEDDEHLGIGGCWNKAIASPHCGKFVVQLDSDDVYSSPDTLTQIWEKFRETGAAAVVGSYVMTDFEKNPIPPGLISHDEWTDSYGADNALRINGFGAPRAYFSLVAREFPFPNVSYGEDYAMMLRISREYKVARIYDPLYLCRRWSGNSDAHLSPEKVNEHNFYKDYLRSCELFARMAENRRRMIETKIDLPF